jgi:4-hydroxybenzoate polyprenyltransferase
MGPSFSFLEQSPSWSLIGLDFFGSGDNLALLTLAISSVLIYTGGMVTNDLFDVDIDRRERPSRPIPSGKIRKRAAALFAIAFLGGGMVLASLLNPFSFFVSTLLVGMVLLYNYKVKNTIVRPHLMAGIRALNVVYGASFYLYLLLFLPKPAFSQPDFSSYIPLVLLILVSTASIFIHIFSLTFLSRRETLIELGQSQNLSLKKVFFLYIAGQGTVFVWGLIFLPFKWLFLAVFVLFIILITCLFYKKMKVTRLQPKDIVYLVKNMLLLLVVVDSAFVIGSVGVYMGLVSLLLTIPSISLSKRIHMT